MASLTVIVTAYDDPEGLKYTLEGLCEQTSEEFDVLIVDNGATEETKELIRSYCKEYVGFESFETEHTLVPAARNEGMKRARGELLWFVDSGDYLAPESVENLLEATEENKADIYVPRYYSAGENEPYYDAWADQLAVVPKIDRFDRALLNILDLDGKVFRKKFFDLYSVTFPVIPKYYNVVFAAKCLFGCDAKVSGVAGAIYSHRRGVFSHGFDEDAQPSGKLLETAIASYEPILADIKALIEEDTGALDGDEYTVQEFLSIYFSVLTDDFYRYFWYIDDDALAALRTKLEEISSQMTKERLSKIYTQFHDLRFPRIYIKHEDAAATPMFSLIAEFTEPEGTGEFLTSLYNQRFPFFEIFVRESVLQSEEFPAEMKDMPNLHAFPDKDYFVLARGNAAGIPVNVKDNAPLDPRLLSELSVSKAPRAVIQYMFAAKRKKYSAKTYLKNKGVAMK